MSKTGQNLSFKYNSDGIRTEKTVNGVTTKYHLVGDMVTYETNGIDTIYYRYDSEGNLLSMKLNGSEYFYIRNGQGDITGLFDSNGVQVVSYSYDSWGKLVSIEGSLKDTVGQKNPYRYRGYRYDTETGLYYLLSRYYNPEWGRFLNADTSQILFEEQGSLLQYNLYVYCFNNPVNRMDPNGYATVFGFIPFKVALMKSAVALGSAATAILTSPLVIAAVASVTVVSVAYVGHNRYKQVHKKKPINLPSFNKFTVDMGHILSGHSPNGNRNPKGKKDVFWGMSTEAIRRAINEAYNHSEKIQTQGERVLLRGYSATNKIVIEMWVNLKHYIIETAYPK